MRNLILDNYLVGGEDVYGLKTRESNPPTLNGAGSVLIPTHAPHTRYSFAKQKQTQIIIELAKRLLNGWAVNGTFALKCLDKINQCSRIINYYHNK